MGCSNLISPRKKSYFNSSCDGVVLAQGNNSCDSSTVLNAGLANSFTIE